VGYGLSGWCEEGVCVAVHVCVGVCRYVGVGVCRYVCGVWCVCVCVCVCVCYICLMSWSVILPCRTSTKGETRDCERKVGWYEELMN
jgi:hypothetical protein